VYSDAIDKEYAEKYGDFKTWGNHAEFWDVLSKKYRYLQDEEYFHYPRGRITYDNVNDKFHIYLNPKLNTPKILEMIFQQFDLTGGNYIVDVTDEHYQL